uniref:Uncharacterized protein n=1 Tax=Pelodiscus sinensis TaxID=13735 RepID=K7FLI2_PELSI
MGWWTTAALRFSLLLLLLTMKPTGRAKAHPMYSSASSAELADFKTLLDLLQSKGPSEEADTGLSHDMNEHNEEAANDALRNNEYARPQREGLAYGHNSWELPEKPLSAPRSLAPQHEKVLGLLRPTDRQNRSPEWPWMQRLQVLKLYLETGAILNIFLRAPKIKVLSKSAASS